LVLGDRATRTLVLASCHDEITSGHFGYDKTLERVKQIVWWPKMGDDIKLYCDTCAVCQRSKRATGKRLGLMQSIEAPKRPWDIINMDFVTGLPPAGDKSYNALLIIICWYS
jgi:hypothetical protein